MLLFQSKRSVRWPYDSTAKTRVVELYIANDFSQYDTYRRDITKVIARTKDIVNIVNSVCTSIFCGSLKVVNNP